MPKRKGKVTEAKAKAAAKPKAEPRIKRRNKAYLHVEALAIMEHEATCVMGLAEDMKRIAGMAKKPEIKDLLAQASTAAEAIAKRLIDAVKGAA